MTVEKGSAERILEQQLRRPGAYQVRPSGPDGFVCQMQIDHAVEGAVECMGLVPALLVELRTLRAVLSIGHPDDVNQMLQIERRRAVREVAASCVPFEADYAEDAAAALRKAGMR